MYNNLLCAYILSLSFIFRILTFSLFLLFPLILPPTYHQLSLAHPSSPQRHLITRLFHTQACIRMQTPFSLSLFLNGPNPFLLSAMNDSLSNQPPVSGGHRPIAEHNGEKMAAVKRCDLVRRGQAVSCSVITEGAGTWKASRVKRSL